MKKTLIAAAALAAMTAACTKDITINPEVEYGYINFGVTSDTEIIVTKGVNSSADLSGYNFTLKNTATSAFVWNNKEYSEIDDAACKVPAGTYSVYVENLTNDEAHPANGMGSVRVAGEVSGLQVAAGATKDCTVACKPVNSKVSCIYTEKFKNVFGETAKVVLDPDGRKLTMSMTQKTESSQTYGSQAYFEAGKTVKWQLTATVDGDQKTYSKTFNTEAAKWSVITFDVSSDNGVINISVTVDDQINDIVNVDGTIDPIS